MKDLGPREDSAGKRSLREDGCRGKQDKANENRGFSSGSLENRKDLLD